MVVRFGIVLLSLVLLDSACTSDRLEFADVVEVKATKQDDKSTLQSPHIAATTKAGSSKVLYNEVSGEIEWKSCFPASKQSTGVYVILSGEGFELNSIDFCNIWLPQVFLDNNYSILAINLPSQGASKGVNDYYGPGTVAAVAAVVEDVSNQHAGKLNFVGVFGYKEASITAASYSRQNPQIKSLILGSGIYDLEIFHKKMNDQADKKLVDELLAKQKDQFYEQRSIAWEFDGLPQKIVLYHGKKDEVIDESLVSSFRNALAAREFNVKYFVLNDQNHQITQAEHQSVLREILKIVQ